MPAALIGAAACGRCGHAPVEHPACPGCGLEWVDAAPSRTGADDGAPLTGVVRVDVVPRALAALIDVASVAVFVTAAVLEATASVDTPVPPVGYGIAALTVLIVQVVAFGRRGRSLGRLLLGQRTVADLTGLPPGAASVLARVDSHRPHRAVTADLRRGRDPLEPVIPELTAPAHGAVPGQSGKSVVGQPGVAPVVVAEAPEPSVGIVLANGERYDIFSSLLLGRSPVDASGVGGHALLAWPDLSRRLAKTHALLEWSGTVLWITDLDTASGTAVIGPGAERRALVPGVRTAAAVGSVVECGGRSLKVVPGGG